MTKSLLTLKAAHALYDRVDLDSDKRVLMALAGAVSDYESSRKRLSDALASAKASVEEAQERLYESLGGGGILPNACGILQQVSRVEVCNGEVHASQAAVKAMLGLAVALGMVREDEFFVG